MRRASITAPIRAAATPPAANPIHAARRCSMPFPLAYCRAVSIGEESDNSLTGGTGENQLREELGCVHLLGLGVAFDEAVSLRKVAMRVQAVGSMVPYFAGSPQSSMVAASTCCCTAALFAASGTIFNTSAKAPFGSACMSRMPE